MNKNEKDHLLYQDLPSIKPRISREDRLSSRRKGDCPDCQPPIEKAKRGAKHLYYFYLVLLAMGIIALQIYNKKNNQDPTIVEQTKTINVSLFQKITITLIEQNSRHGISILFRNNSGNRWTIKNILVSVKNTEVTKNTEVNQIIKKDSFYSLFIPLSKEFNNIKEIDVFVPS